ncbi:hypothetical protein F5B21DRAFT_505715 [Xylaria acuta]|nr:hypothetical protein F5B21DRAFT_505715 [Xylaria acuta]
MSGHHDPARNSATGSDSSARPVYNDQSRITGVVRNHQQHYPTNVGEQTEVTQQMDLPPPVHLQYLEMQLARQYRFIQDLLRPRSWPLRVSEINPSINSVGINPNTQEIVPKDFVEQAHRDRAELGDLRQALKEKMEECDKIREHRQAAVGELSDLKSSKQTFMVDDAEMISKWNQLQYGIKNLARTYLHNPISPKRLTQEQGELLELVSPLYQEFLSAEGKVHLLFQSLLWMYITVRILWSPAKVWGGNLSSAFDTLLKLRYDSKEDYHSWRAQTAGIIHNAKGIHNKTAWHLKGRIHSTIVQFIPEEILSDERHGEIIDRSVERIVDKAIEIAVIFNQSRCLYRLRRVIHRERFSPKAMEYDEDCDAPQVDLMISPGLLKFGNSKGEDYDQRLVLAKSHVCTLKQGIEEETDEGEDGECDTDESDGKGNREGKGNEDDCLIDL